MTSSDGGGVAAALAAAHTHGVARLDAQLLLAHVLGRSRSWLIAHDDATLTAVQSAAFRALLERRAALEPLAYLVGAKEFHGLMLTVGPGVLVPRPETEVLVDWAIELLRSRGVASVLDLGTGSGAIALAVKQACPSAQVTAVDASAMALDVARNNGRRLSLDVCWLESDWWSALGARRFDLVLSNPPYVALGDPHLAGLWCEPEIALLGGTDGLDALAHLATTAPPHLNPGGSLLLEHGHAQREAVRALLGRHGFVGIETRADLAGHPRCSAGQVAAGRQAA